MIDVIQTNAAFNRRSDLGLADRQSRIRFAGLPKPTNWFDVHISNVSIYLIIAVPVLRFIAYFVQERCNILISWFAKHFWEMVQSSCLRLTWPVLSLNFA